MRVYFNWEAEFVKQAWNKCPVIYIAEYMNITASTLRSFVKKHKLCGQTDTRKSVGYRPTRESAMVILGNIASKCKSKPGATEVFSGKKSDKAPQTNHSYSNTSDQLCWHCCWATGAGDCEWANSGQPVPGWNAEPYNIRQKVKGELRYVESYTIFECPKFKSDEEAKMNIPERIIHQ